VILRDYEFEMAQPSETYRDDVTKMVIQLQQPCRVRYQRRARCAMRIVVDRDLCQGHAMCASEAPAVFAVGKRDDQVSVLDEMPPPSERDAVRRAITYCPTGALSVQED
jgi:sterol 14-demethylase